MKSETAGFKTYLVGTGGFTPSLSEYISRECRLQLVNVAVEALRKEHNKQLKLKERRGEPYKHGGWNISPQLILARAVGVTKKAVDNWLDGIKHPCNINVDKILHIASDYDQDRVLHILEEDLFSHQYSLGIFRDSLANYSYPLAENWGVPTKKEEAVV